MIFSGKMGLCPCNRRENLDKNCRLVYLLVGWALRPCDRENLERNCRLGYLVVGWALRPCDWSENFDRNCRVGFTPV